jgi:hypothetical protein
MRALPLIERMLVIGCAFLAVAMVAFAVVWHLRWTGMVAYYAAQVPRPGLPAMPAAASPPAPALTGEFDAWRSRQMQDVERSSAQAQIMPYERDRLRELLAAPVQGSPRSDPPLGTSAALLAGFIARGLRLDGAPIPTWRSPEADYRRWAETHGNIPGLDAAVDELAGHWLRVLAGPAGPRPADADAMLGAFATAVAACDQPDFYMAYRRWQRLQGARDAAFVVAALVARSPDPEHDAWRVREAAWLAEPGAGITVQVQFWERFRLQVAPLWSLREFSCLPLGDLRPWNFGYGNLFALRNWWGIPVNARNTAWSEGEDDLIARRKSTSRNYWSPWQNGTQTLPGMNSLGIRADNLHRLAVLAATALDARGADGAFPGEAAACGISAAALDGGGDMPPLILHVDARHLLIAIDRRATLAPYLADCFAPSLSSTGEDGALPLSLTPEAVSIDIGDAQVRAMIAGDVMPAAVTGDATEAAATATGAAP